jgi:hypothetical protein
MIRFGPNRKDERRPPPCRNRAQGAWRLDLPGEPGPKNALTDVPGVLVGHTTIIDDSKEGYGAGPIRTGVTAILPRGRESHPRPVWAGQFSLNGNGEMTGVHWIHDGGYLVGPICITNTHAVGIVHHAATRWTLDHYAETFRERHLWAMPDLRLSRLHPLLRVDPRRQVHRWWRRPTTGGSTTSMASTCRSSTSLQRSRARATAHP